MDGKDYSWNTWGEILTPGKDSEVWATYTDEFYNGKPAVTTRRFGKGTVTYVGIDSHDGIMEKDIMKKLFNMLDIPVMDLPYGVTLEYRNGFGIVLNYSDKPYEFTLPKGAKVLIGDTEIPTAGVLVFSI
jgi:beta-galactosidase